MRLRCMWTVTAGIITGVIMPEYTRQWLVGSDEWDMLSDQQKGDLILARREAVHEYARDITNPNAINWVKTEFMWM